MWSALLRRKGCRPRRGIVAGGCKPRSRGADCDIDELTILMIECGLLSSWYRGVPSMKRREH